MSSPLSSLAHSSDDGKERQRRRRTIITHGVLLALLLLTPLVWLVVTPFRSTGEQPQVKVRLDSLPRVLVKEAVKAESEHAALGSSTAQDQGSHSYSSNSVSKPSFTDETLSRRGPVQPLYAPSSSTNVDTAVVLDYDNDHPLPHNPALVDRTYPSCDGYSFKRGENDLRPFAREYLEKYVLIVVVANGSAPLRRMDFALCTWLSLVPSESILVMTDVPVHREGLPGQWMVSSTPARKMTMSQRQRYNVVKSKNKAEKVARFKAEKVARFKAGRATRRTATRLEAEEEAKLTYYDAMSSAIQAVLQSEERDGIRWVVVLNDDVFVNLNALVLSLHRHDIRNAFEQLAPGLTCEANTRFGYKWMAKCDRMANLNGKDDTRQKQLCVCTSIPFRMCGLLETVRNITGLPDVTNATLREQLALATYRLNDDNAPGYAALWQLSLNLFHNRWVRERIMPPVHLTRPYQGEVGHCFNRAFIRKMARQVTHELPLLLAHNQFSFETAMAEFLGDRPWVRTYSDRAMCTTRSDAPEYANCLSSKHTKQLEKLAMSTLHIPQVVSFSQRDAAYLLSLFYQHFYQHSQTAIPKLRKHLEDLAKNEALES